jgi:ABC-type glycerol-3-phosphate transport system substrate-binding protein
MLMYPGGNMKKSRIILSAIAAVAMIASVTSCGGKKEEAKKLVIWSFTDELQTMVDKYYKVDHPDVEVEYSLTPTDQFPNKLDPVLANGNGAPDVFALEDAFVRKYIEQGDSLLLDLTDVYNEVKDKMIAYPCEIGMHNGKVYGLSWQAAPGAMFYRRSLAKKYLGTDDPAEVQKYLTDWNKFNETAKTLYEKSNGKCVIVSTTGDLFKPFQGARKDPWVVNGKLVVDPAMEAYMDACKFLKDNGYEGRQGQWAEGWFAGMKGELKDEQGNDVEVFSYFLPTWGLHYVLKPNSPNTSGDWAMTAGPAAYRWGGTWVAAYKGTKVPNLAKGFIKYVATDDSFLERWAKDTGDVVSNNNVINKIKDTYSEPYLGGQNHYAEFAVMANNVDGKLTQGTDQAIEGIWGEAVTAYVNGEKSKEQAIADFKDQVKSTLGF